MLLVLLDSSRLTCPHCMYGATMYSTILCLNILKINLVTSIGTTQFPCLCPSVKTLAASSACPCSYSPHA